MNIFFYVILYTFSICFTVIQTQILPIWATSNIFYAAGGSAFLVTDQEDFTVTFPTGFTISTAKFRYPFIAINQI
jgi:hypothetical protein